MGREGGEKMSFDFPGKETFLVSCMIGFGFAWRIFLGWV